MAEHSSKELPIASWVYIKSEDGRHDIRAADFFQPTLLYNPFYSKSVKEFGKSGYDGIRSKLIATADINHLGGIASLLGQQLEIFSMLENQFAEYAGEKKLPKEFVGTFFVRAAAKYRELAFAEQSGRLEKLKEATGAQLDLLEVLKNPDDARFGEMTAAYQRIHDVVRSFAAVTLHVSELYDTNERNLYGVNTVPADLVKFGKEPEIILPETQLSVDDMLSLAASEVARNPVFVAGIRRRSREAIDDLGRLAKRAIHFSK